MNNQYRQSVIDDCKAAGHTICVLNPAEVREVIYLGNGEFDIYWNAGGFSRSSAPKIPRWGKLEQKVYFNLVAQDIPFKFRKLMVPIVRLLASDGRYSSIDLEWTSPDELPEDIESFERNMQQAGLEFVGLEYGYAIV
jgi:hypothetical protein